MANAVSPEAGRSLAAGGDPGWGAPVPVIGRGATRTPAAAAAADAAESRAERAGEEFRQSHGAGAAVGAASRGREAHSCSCCAGESPAETSSPGQRRGDGRHHCAPAPARREAEGVGLGRLGWGRGAHSHREPPHGRGEWRGRSTNGCVLEESPDRRHDRHDSGQARGGRQGGCAHKRCLDPPPALPPDGGALTGGSAARRGYRRRATQRVPFRCLSLRTLLARALMCCLLGEDEGGRPKYGVGAVSYSPSCPSGYYSSPSTFLNITMASSRSFPSGDIPASSLQEWGEFHRTSTVLACDVYFPNAPRDIMLWHFGFDDVAPKLGAWLGLRDTSGTDGPVLRLRAGGGDQLPQLPNDDRIAFVDVNYSRFQDGQVHQVVAWIEEDGGAVKLWVDGELQMGRIGSAELEPALAAWTVDDEDGSFASRSTPQGYSWPPGEPVGNWTGDGAMTASDLKFYQPAMPGDCTATAATPGYGNLLGDWVSASGLGYVCCESCPDNSRVNTSHAGTGIGGCQCNAGYFGPDGGVCAACPAGSEKTSLGSAACSTCEAGKYISYTDTLSGMTCQECPAGKYNTSTGATSCADCPVGSYKEASGSGTCILCRNTTTTSSPGATSCNVCVRNAFPRFLDAPISSYQNTLADTICVVCPNHSMPSLCASTGACAVNDLSNCTCNVGYYGTIDSSPGGGSCTACPYGTTTASQGAVNLSQCVCKAGFESNYTGVACTMCKSGTDKSTIGSVPCTSCGTDDKEYITTSDDGSTCICKAGAYRSSGKCKPCLAGFAKAISGDQACTRCARGKYTPSTNTGAVHCLSCPQGKYNSKIGAFGSECYACKECPLNTDSLNATGKRTGCVSNAGYSAKDGNIGVACVVGKYKAENGSAACSSCAAVISTSAVASTRCSCSLGHYSANASVTGSNCLECAIESAANETGSEACHVCPQGTYTSNYGTGSTACSACPSGSYSYATRRQLSDCTCNTGFTGSPPNSTCTACAQGTYKNVSGADVCSVCPTGKYQGADAQSVCINCPRFGTTEQTGSTSFPQCLCNAGYTSKNETYYVNCTKWRTLMSETFSGSNSSNTTNGTAITNYIEESYLSTCPRYRMICDACPVGSSRAGLGNGDCEACKAQSHTWASSCFQNDVANCEEVPAQEYCSCNYGYVQNGGVTSPCTLCTLKTDSSPDFHPLNIDGWNEYLGSPDSNLTRTCDLSGTKVLGVCDTGITKADSNGQCAAGRWWRECSINGDSACMMCPANSYNAQGSEGRLTCKCNKGYSGPDGGPCSACPANHYKNRTSDYPCVPCPGITVSPNGSVSVVNCTCPMGFESALGDNASSSAQSDPATYTSDCQCAPGYFKPYPNSSCIGCATGKFNNWSASTYCDACEIGFFAKEVATTACVLCTPVSRCPIGQFWNTCPGPVDGHCKPCSREVLPGNASFSGPGVPIYRDACPFKCNAGYDAIGPANEDTLENPTTCSACPVGKYRGKYSGRCENCLHPATTRAAGSAYCIDCAQGYCFSGFLAEGHAECVECPSPRTTTRPSGYARGFTDRCRCEPGYDGYSWNCAKCQPGTYKSEITESSDFELYWASVQGGDISTSDTCQLCPVGSFNARWGSIRPQACEKCSTNSFTHIDTSICACNAGYYDAEPDDLQLNPSCSPCPVDTFNEDFGKEDANDCLQCPTDSYSPVASNSSLNCTCNAGFEGAWSVERRAIFSDPGGANWDDFCDPCPDNSYATLNDNYCIQCPNGTFTNSYDRTSLDVCLCPADTYGVLNVSHWTKRGPPYNDWVANNDTQHHCIDCPVNSTSPSGSADISSCVCIHGTSGLPRDGGGCKGCPGESFPHVSPDYCSCNAGYYDDFSNGVVSNFIVPDDFTKSCTVCPSHSFSPAASIGVEQCHCNNGYYGVPGDGGCIQCPSYSHSTEENPTERSFCVCNAGFSGDPGGYLDCVRCTDLDNNSHTHISTDFQMCTCNMGYFGNLYNDYNDSFSCAPCPLHTYNNQINQWFVSACAACQNFSTTDSVGSDEFTDCKCDTGYRHLGEECVPCEEEEYQDSRGAHSCKPCVANSYSPVASGSASDCECKPGFYRSGHECVACAPGFFKTFLGDAPCDACPANSTSLADPDRTSCECVAGHYGGPDPQFGSPCTACPAGKKQPDLGKHDSSDCIDCPSLAWSAPGSSQCVCKANTYGDPNANPPVDCVACTQNAVAVQDSHDVTDCMCTEGFYLGYNTTPPLPITTPAPGSAGQVCLPSSCAFGSISMPAAATASDCHCDENFWGDPMNGVSCEACPANATSPVNTLNLSGCVCRANFWGDPSRHIACTKCPDNAVSTVGSKRLQDCSCAQGYFGTPELQATPAPSNANIATSPVPESAQDSVVNMCPTTKYGQLLDLTANASSHAFSPSEENFDPLGLDDANWYTGTAIISCRITFPASVEDSTLWFIGDENRSASLVLLGGNSTPTLRLRAGDSIPNTTNRTISNTTNSTSSDPISITPNATAVMAIIDVTDFPSDGLFHEVVAIVGCPGPRLLLYIDGLLQGHSESPAAAAAKCSDAKGWTSPHASAYGSTGSARVWHDGVVWPDCAGAAGSHVLWGDYTWGNGSLPGNRTSACCISCPDQFQISVGNDRSQMSSCSCTAGYTGPAQGPCVACPMGTFKSALGSAECSACGYGEYTLAAGSTGCVSPTCKACPANAAVRGNSTTSSLADCACKAGYFGNASLGVDCAACPSSSSSPVGAFSSDACGCDQGYYGHVKHAAQGIECHLCPANSAPSVPSPRYVQNCSCAAGYYGRPMPFSSPACQACPVNTYRAQPGALNISDCTPCPSNSTTMALTGAASRGSCLCDKGFFGDLSTSGAVCQECPRDTYAPDVGALSQSYCRFCPDNSAAPAPAATNITDCVCNSGYSGAITAVTAPGQADVCI